jgi:hypothetical protein
LSWIYDRAPHPAVALHQGKKARSIGHFFAGAPAVQIGYCYRGNIALTACRPARLPVPEKTQARRTLA